MSTATPSDTASALQSPASSAGATTIRPDEAAHFGKMAADWWDPKGSSAMLHRLNPVRLAFIREAVDAHFRTMRGLDGRGPEDTSHPGPANAQTPRGLDAPAPGNAPHPAAAAPTPPRPDSPAGQLKPLSGRRALDVGCGAGLLCEPLARLGADVTGVDAAAENIAAAKAHAAAMGLAITYRCGDIATLPSAHPGLVGFDLVTAMEVIEHVADKPAFIAALAAALAPNGLMLLSCPNRTAKSRLLLVEGAERLGMIPRGTHHWHDFITPDELRDLLAEAGLTMGQPRGIGWSPAKGLHLSDDMALNYIVAATRK